MTNLTRRDITVVGGSAGAVPVLQQMFADLPADYPAAVFVVLHVPPEAPAVLANLLDRHSVLPVRIAQAGGPIVPSTVTVAPPDLHVVLDGATVQLTRGPRENAQRPSIDVLFRSAAVALGPQVTGVLLSGMLDDGAAGLWAIKRRGGVAVVQDPADAAFPELPSNAIAVTEVDLQVPARELAPALVRIAREAIDWPSPSAPESMAREVRMAAQNDSDIAEVEALGRQVPMTCPECGGSLWQLEEGGPRFRCHVGHAYSLQCLDSEQTMRVEAALWAALRSLQQRQRLAERMAHDARLRGNDKSAEYQLEVMRAHAAHAETLRRLLAEGTRAGHEQTGT